MEDETEYKSSTKFFSTDSNQLQYFLVCHMIGVASTCVNPILYGFLNDNIATEISKLHPSMKLTNSD